MTMHYAHEGRDPQCLSRGKRVPILDQWNEAMQGPKPSHDEEDYIYATDYDPTIPRLEARWKWSGIKNG